MSDDLLKGSSEVAELLLQPLWSCPQNLNLQSDSHELVSLALLSWFQPSSTLHLHSVPLGLIRKMSCLL